MTTSSPRPGAARSSTTALLIALFIGIVIAAIGSFALWRDLGRAVEIVDAPNGKLQCLSYTPFRGKQTPFDAKLMIPPQQIDDDLHRLKAVTDCVRTYATDQGLDQVLPIAQQLGMKVLMGIWIGRNPADNEKQIQQGIDLAKKYPQALRGIIVGNEVLLRGEQTPVALTAMLKRVKAATGIPVTYADVWEFWRPGNDRVGPGLADLAAAADFITIHILPYWEDQPIASAQGVDHLKDIYGVIKAAYPDKQVLIGETGFPSAGRQRDLAVPSIVDEARYIREFIAYANSIHLDYNLIEAFDQPWKRDLEGTVGGYWGVFNGDREQKFPLTGPVSNYPNWQSDWGIVLAIGAILLALTAWPRRRDLTVLTALALPILAVGAGGLLILYARRIGVVAFLWHEIAVEAFLWLVAALTAIAALSALTARHGDTERASVAAIIAGHADLRQRGNWLALLQLISVLGATVVSLGLAFDARYRDFPSLAFAVPALAHALLMLTGRDRAIDMRRGDRREEAMISLILIAASLAIPVIEGPHNLRALIWTVEALLIALPWLRYWPAFFFGTSRQAGLKPA
jgi:glucan 1,3-beta-glucosidase